MLLSKRQTRRERVANRKPEFEKLEDRKVLSGVGIAFTGGQMADIAVDIVGDFYMAGEFTGVMSHRINSGPSVSYFAAQNQSAIVAKHDHDGELVWKKAFTGSGTARAVQILENADANGNNCFVTVLGTYQGMVNFGSGFALTSAATTGFEAVLDLVTGDTISVSNAGIAGPGDGVELDAIGTVYTVQNGTGMSRTTAPWEVALGNNGGSITFRTIDNGDVFCEQPLRYIQLAGGQTFVADIVDSINVRGGRGNDVVTLDFSAFLPEVECDIRFFSGGGSDTIALIDGVNSKSYSASTDFNATPRPTDGDYFPYTFIMNENTTELVTTRMRFQQSVNRVEVTNLLQFKVSNSGAVSKNAVLSNSMTTLGATEFFNGSTNYTISGIGDYSTGGVGGMVFDELPGPSAGNFYRAELNGSLSGAVHYRFDLSGSNPAQGLPSNVGVINTTTINVPRNVMFGTGVSRLEVNGDTAHGDADYFLASASTYTLLRFESTPSVGTIRGQHQIGTVIYSGSGQGRTFNATSYRGTLIANGNGGDDTIRGGSGNDTIRGGDGHDSLIGGAGHDTLYGGTGSDFMTGQAGNDTLFGDDGDDSLLGGDGNDTLNGGQGNDYLRGDAGNDQIYGDQGADRLVYFGSNANDNIVGFVVSNNSRQFNLNRYDSSGSLAETDEFFSEVGQSSNFGLDRLSIFGLDGNDQINVSSIENKIFGDYIDGGNGFDTFTGDPLKWTTVNM